MKYFYRLKFRLESSEQANAITRILNKQPTRCGDYSWEVDFQESDLDQQFHGYLDYVESILTSAASALEGIGIKPGDVSVWVLYEYEEQCNLEFPPNQVKRLYDLGVSLCISCWQT